PTADLVCAYKPQFAHSAACEAEDQLERTIEYIHKTHPGVPVILDAKRGDVGDTAERYAIEAFERYGADAVTVNPYLGSDSLEPFLEYADKGVVILCRTSNPGARDLQDRLVGSRKLYQVVAELAARRWNSRGNCLLVVGATYPADLAEVRALVGDMALLVPGVGAQRGDVAQVVHNGQTARGFEAQSILRDLCEGLTTLDRKAAVAPGVASTWGVSTDGRVYVFKLRREARWSNGDPVVAADFVAGLRRLVDPATASGYAQYIDVIANAGDIVAGRKPPQALGVAAPDDSTVVVTLATPAPYLPTLLSHPSACPVHRPTLAAHPEGLARPGVMLSNGAFVLQEWVPGSYILARRNPYYWNNAATRLDAVKYLLIPDENAELTRYRGGELEVTFVVPRGQFDWIKANLADQLHVSPQL